MTPVRISLSLKTFTEHYFHPENGQLMMLAWWCVTFLIISTMSQRWMLVPWPFTDKQIYTAHFAIVYMPVSVHVHVCGVCVCVCVCGVCACVCVVCVCVCVCVTLCVLITWSLIWWTTTYIHTYARPQWVSLKHLRNCSVVNTYHIMYICRYTLDTCTSSL